MAGRRRRHSCPQRGGEHRARRSLAARPGLSRRAQDRGGRRQLDRRHPRGGRTGIRQRRSGGRDRGRSAAGGLDRQAMGRAARGEAGGRNVARHHPSLADRCRHRASFRQRAPFGRQGRRRGTRPRLVDGALAMPILLGAAAGTGVRLLLSEALSVSSRQRFDPSRSGRRGWLHAGPQSDAGGGGRNCRDSRSTDRRLRACRPDQELRLDLARLGRGDAKPATVSAVTRLLGDGRANCLHSARTLAAATGGDHRVYGGRVSDAGNRHGLGSLRRQSLRGGSRRGCVAHHDRAPFGRP